MYPDHWGKSLFRIARSAWSSAFSENGCEVLFGYLVNEICRRTSGRKETP